MKAQSMKKTAWVFGLALGTLSLTGCDEREIVLPGEREELRSILQEEAASDIVVEVENRSLPIHLAAQVNNSKWVQRIGTQSTRVSHPALGQNLQPLWATSIGTGDSRKGRISADPVVAQGRIFTLDSVATVAATSTNGGHLWSRSLVPDRDGTNDASGGGLAYGDGKLFVSSGFGLMTAIDPKTGDILWQQKLEATGSGSPSYSDGLVYVVAGDNLAWALNADTGRIAWQLSATSDINNVFGGPAPTITDQFVIFSFGSGEMQAAFRQGGLRIWDAAISGRRRGLARTHVADITGDPVVVGDVAYVGSHTGRMVALNVNNGNRIWTAPEGPLNPVWPAGGSLFFVSDRNELIRLDAKDGSRIWGVKLPFFVKERPKRQKEIFAHYGPVLAGGRLIVASNDGLIRSFDPKSGALISTVEIAGGATTNPVIAGGVLYLVSTKGQLHAFR